MSRSISEMAAMIRFPAQAHPAVHAAEIQSPAHIPVRKKSHGMRSGDLDGQRSSAWSSVIVRQIQHWGKC
jgi:hypothetical protein